jgi:titin
VQGNFIGTDAAGAHALGNDYGVVVTGPSNTIGGTAIGAGNLISGNHNDGVLLNGLSAQRNLVQANFIGTDVRGAFPLFNQNGVAIVDGSNNEIGGSVAGAGNLISGNAENGILISDATRNVVAGNLIGTDAAGIHSVRNDGGVTLTGATDNLIGGSAPGTGNVISGNGGGILMEASTGNQIQGNWIGTDTSGTQNLGNLFGDIWPSTGAEGNLIGGTMAGARNIISGDAVSEIYVSMGADNNPVQGNFIGTDVTGTHALGSRDFPGNGILILPGALDNTIGGTELGAGNLISGNLSHASYGVFIAGAGTLLQGNSIGTDVTGTRALGNTEGVEVNANDITIGGTEPGAGNLISGNQKLGITLWGVDHVVILGNRIGTDVTGTQALGNGAAGILVYSQGSTTATIGGTDPGAGNLISANLGDGISIQTSDTAAIVVQGNTIGTDITGTQPLGNAGNGVAIIGGTNDNTISGNLIAFNGVDGVLVNGGTGTAILGNAILGHDNGLGIELANGGNDDQAFPVLTSATTDGSSTTVEGTLASTSSTSFRVEIFANAVCNPSGYGEGERFLGALTVTTDADGNATFSFTAPIGVNPGQFVAATATDPTGNTSEFSACTEVTTSNSPKQISVATLRFPSYCPGAMPESHDPFALAIGFPIPDNEKAEGHRPSLNGGRVGTGDAPAQSARFHIVTAVRCRPMAGQEALDIPLLISLEI